MSVTLVIGANGQIGSELVEMLSESLGPAAVIAADLAPPRVPGPSPFVCLDVLDRAHLREVVQRHAVSDVYLLAAVLSARGEAAPLDTWRLNIDSLLNLLELAREGAVRRLFWPSSIAAFGPHSPRTPARQWSVMDPTTMYGASKLAGERLCAYYFARYGVDVRSIRLPGVISHRTPPGGGTTDYAIAMFHAAKRGEVYRCFVDEDTVLPMIFMPDALRAMRELMQADPARVRIRSSYNVAGVSFSAGELAAEIARRVPGFAVSYAPDFRQAIADSWPAAIDDRDATEDWGWRPRFGLSAIAAEMLAHVRAS
ncbi:MAG TPA: NAD-dependent epimerase/dehydratase family protein [Casimicrobiaceae bacterium]